MSDLQVSDTRVRQQAIDPTQSFIIQAPAGSGKTELLTQRYLNLLANAVRHPEEIIAITFTRKAAAEMHHRILRALEAAVQTDSPEEPYQKKTRQLAQAVLKKDHTYQWELLHHPHRMRILTIDALNSMLCARSPFLSGISPSYTVTENATALYEQAVARVLTKPDPAIETAVAELLLHVDNQAQQLLHLFVQLLQKREQWLPHILRYYHNPEQLRESLENSLRQLIEEKIMQAERIMPLSMQRSVESLMRFAGIALSANKLESWKNIAEFLLTQEYTWRKTVNKNRGFPPSHPEEKKQMLALLELLQQDDSTYDILRSCLTDILHCPLASYLDTQWNCIEALMHVLPFITAELETEFQKHHTFDFIALSLGAFRALGEPEDPTDLALHLDYRIRHILIDEFQDTSVTQYRLLQQLVQSWSPEDDKTLFFVGDPMQSIYRFRQAEVSLFMRVQQEGFGAKKLKSLCLTQNFRSHEALVTWFNQTFSRIFPAHNDITLGAIAYNPSLSASGQSAPEMYGVHYYSTSAENKNDAVITTIIHHLRHSHPTDRIAVLARTRAQLQTILPSLHRENIVYEAIDIETLYQRQEVIDVLALTKALLNWSDRTAWLSVLRAPWCGLSLKDLHCLTLQAGLDNPLWPCFNTEEKIKQLEKNGLSTDALSRIQPIVAILQPALEQIGRVPLAIWIRNIWLDLMDRLATENAKENAYHAVQHYFELLESMQYTFNITALEKKLQMLYVKSANSDPNAIQLMTIHKAKGLEFHHVILPDLQYQPPPEKKSLLMWLENPCATDQDDLILAPVAPTEEAINSDPIYRYLKHLEAKKQAFEMRRVLYVAATRAQHSLHLVSRLKTQPDGTIMRPYEKSFLSFIWESCHTHFSARQ